MKSILIAGAGKGIGLSIARLLSANNDVWAITRSKSDELEKTKATIFYGDVSDVAWLDSLRLPDIIDGLVYCPGSINLKPFGRLTTNDFLLDFEQNVLGAVRLIQKSIPKFKKK